MRSSTILQYGLWFLGGIFFVWAFLDPRFQDAEGFLDGAVALPVSTGVASLISAWLIGKQLSRFAFWLALALIGQAVALQLIEAGSALRYQHYQPVDRLLKETDPLLLTYLAAQLTTVVIGLKNYWPRIRAWLGRNFKAWQLLGVALVFFLFSATVSRQVTVYLTELAVASFIQLLNLGNIVLMALALPEDTMIRFRQRIDKLIGKFKQDQKGDAGRIDRFVIVAAIWVIILAATLSFFSYERHPHVPDEVAYLYHARYLADGVLTLPAPPVPNAFELYLMQVEEERWYPSPPPGWPAVLAIGVISDAPWLVNPILAGLNILTAYILLQELYPRRIARLAVLLLCFSPWYVFMGMNFMTHMFTLTCALVATVGVLWARRTDKAIWAWLGGLALGMMALIRPLEALAVASLLGLWAIGIGGKRLKVSATAGLILASMIVGASALLYNNLLTGDPTVFPIMAYTNEYFGPNTNALGFGPDRGMGWAIDPYPGHSPRDALINANLNIFSINTELFGWSIGSLIVVAVMVLSGKLQKSDYLMLAVIVAIFVPHFFYYFSGGPDFGARYWFLMVIPLAALTARGIQFLERTFGSGAADATNAGNRVMAAVLLLCLLALVNYFPWRAIDKYHHFRGMRPDVRYLAEEYEFGKSLVLIRGNQHTDYASAAIYNPLNLREDAPLYVWDPDPEVRAQVLAAYPDRPVWAVDGPSVTQAGFKVVEGPLSAHELMAQDNKIR